MGQHWVYGGILGILLLAVLASACTGIIPTYSESNNGQTVHVKAGESFRISLSETPSIPFRWIVNVTDGLEITGEDYVSGNPIGDLMGMVGGGGDHIWELKAVRAGSQIFSADLTDISSEPGYQADTIRPGEVAISDTFLLTVIVEDR